MGVRKDGKNWNLDPKERAEILFYIGEWKSGELAADGTKYTAESIGKLFGISGRNVTKTYVPKWEEITRLNINNSMVKADWNNIQALVDSGVYREHLPALLQVDAWSRHFFGTTDFDPSPSYRELRWQSHVLSYTHSITKPSDIWAVGQQLTLRDTTAYYAQTEVKNDDLNQWLGYEPWANADKETRYLDAILAGVIKPIERDYENYVQLGTAQLYKGSLSNILFSLAEGKEYLLPSQQIALHKERTGDNTITVQFKWGDKEVIKELRI